VLEGVIYNHRIHVDALRQRFGFSSAMLTGGPSRSTLFNQLFADVLNLPVTVTATEEAAAWGAALCAGAGVGLYHSPLDDPRDLAAISKTYEPREDRVPMHEERYQLFCDMAEAMKPFWPRLEALAGKG
jgi:L-xylulokinase